MKKSIFLMTLKIFLLIFLGCLANITQKPNAHFLGAKAALADIDYEYYDIPEPINEPYTEPDTSADWSWLSDYDIPEPINEPYTEPDNSNDNGPTDTETLYFNGQEISGNNNNFTQMNVDGGTNDSQGNLIKWATENGQNLPYYVYEGENGSPRYSIDNDGNAFYWDKNGLPTYDKGQAVDLEGGGSGSASVPNGFSAVGTVTDTGNMAVRKDSTGEMFEVSKSGQYFNLDGSYKSIDYSGSAGTGGTSDVSGARDLIGTNQYGNPMYKDSSGNIYELGANGFNNAAGSDMVINPISGNQQNASGQFQIGQGATTSFVPAQIITGPDGKLYQTAGGQTVPYTGSVVSGGYVGSGGGLFGALGSAVGSVVGGVGSAVGSVVGGVSSLLFGTGGTPGYGSVGGYSNPTGYYGAAGGYSSPSGYYSSPTGYYGAAGGYAASPTATSTAGGWNPARYVSTGLPAASIYSVVQNIVMWALSIFGFFGIIGFVISGVWYLLASGDDTLMKRAKNGMLYSIIGVVVGLIGLVIIFAANSLLRGSWFF